MEYFEIARTNMVKNQIMPNKVTDPLLLGAFSCIPKHEFVEKAWQGFAYSDARVPLNDNRKILAPEVLARMISVLELTPEKIALDIACGTGYTSSILSKICKHVIAIENNPDLAQKAAINLQKLDIKNVEIKQSDLLKGDHKNAPYDAILVSGALTSAPENLISQLKIGGKLVYIKTLSPHLCKVMLAQNWGHSFDEIELFDTFCEPLV
ncbi:MAG: protein-L-isoaspartate O-methyltransferase [Candidatus Midichloriaceae bacterium]|jgi:protein-L-isoaspartate(D-aspartate) O-methyltransferase|nr:protein-L-isoaspartate O-methyltransferase [Candidatus Midichloriaceae bacterium]